MTEKKAKDELYVPKEIIMNTPDPVKGSNKEIMKRWIYRKLFNVFTNLGTIETDKTNQFLHYNYASFDKVKEVVRKELLKERILFLFESKVILVTPVNKKDKEGNDETNLLTDIEATFTFVDVDTGDTLTFLGTGQAMDKEGKGLSKAKTDAIKRLFTDTFLISAGEEDEDAVLGAPKSEVKKPASSAPVKVTITPPSGFATKPPIAPTKDVITNTTPPPIIATKPPKVPSTSTVNKPPAVSSKTMSVKQFMEFQLKAIKDLNPEFYSNIISVLSEKYGEKFPDNLTNEDYSNIVTELKLYVKLSPGQGR